MIKKGNIHNPIAAANRRRITQVVPSHKGKGTPDKRKEDKKDAFKHQENAYKKGE